MEKYSIKSGDDFYKKGKETLKSWKLFNKSGKYTKAVKHFQSSAQAYTIEGKNEKAGEAYYNMAKCFNKLNSNDTAAQHFIMAAKFTENQDKSKSLDYLLKALNLQQQKKNYSEMALIQFEISKLLDTVSIDVASKNYQQAILWFEKANSLTKVYHSCLEKYAEIQIKLNNVEESIQVLEKKAMFEIITFQNLKLNPIKSLFSSLLVSFAAENYEKCIKSLCDYEKLTPKFFDSMERRFIFNMIYNNYEFDEIIVDQIELGNYYHDSLISSLLVKAKDNYVLKKMKE
jgi:tetratricopeptide (TPR) repeat protein